MRVRSAWRLWLSPDTTDAGRSTLSALSFAPQYLSGGFEQMRRTFFLSLSLAVFCFITVAVSSQEPQTETSRSVAGGGVSVPGWTGEIDAKEKTAGMTLNSAKFGKEGDALHVVTGPAATYWNPANKASGDYTIKATFREPKFMNLNTHPHPYGIVIAGNDLGTEQQSYLYCAAYGTGNFIVRGFGPAPFQMNGRRGEAGASLNKAAGKDQPVPPG